jgi:hypothetical protein
MNQNNFLFGVLVNLFGTVACDAVIASLLLWYLRAALRGSTREELSLADTWWLAMFSCLVASAPGFAVAIFRISAFGPLLALVGGLMLFYVTLRSNLAPLLAEHVPENTGARVVRNAFLLYVLASMGLLAAVLQLSRVRT